MSAVAAVLAAGSASRFGADKLGALLDGRPLLFHAIEAARAAPVSHVIVVAREGIDTGQWNGVPPVSVLTIESSALSQSLKVAASRARSLGASGLYVFLGDMPRIPHKLAHELAREIGDNWAAAPRHLGQPGHPVLFSAAALPRIEGLSGDAGAGKLLRERSDVAWLDWPDPGVTLDVDRPADLERLRDTRG